VELTVVLTNYLRPNNMQVILDALALQSLPHRVLVWDNSPNSSFPVERADWVVQSSQNARCSARWWLAAHAETPWVLVMDDDLAPAHPNTLAFTIEKLREHAGKVIGAAGVQLTATRHYFECQHVGLEALRVTGDIGVDIVKGRYFALPIQVVQKLPYIPLDAEDDIIVSAVTGGGVVPAGLPEMFRELPTNRESRFHRPNHAHARESTRRRYFSGR
jgi:hypothetical protein